MSMFSEVLIQAGYYGVVLVLAIGFVGLILKGFFWKYVKVRLSFGRLVLVKVRSKLQDSFLSGWVEDGFLVFKNKKDEFRLSLKDKQPIYRSLSVNWIDVDEEKNAICNADYSTVEGYDAKKYNDLYTRALMRPSIGFGKEKLIIVLIIICVIASLGALYMGYRNSEALTTLLPQITAQVNNLIEVAKGTITGSATNI